MSTHKVKVTVAQIDGAEVRDLRRLVDLLCAIQVCWPTAQAEYVDESIIVTVLRDRPDFGTGAA